MASGEHKGLVARWLEGKERSDDYARSTLPSSRFGLFWDIFKGRFGRLILVNLLVLVTLLPVIGVCFWRYVVMAVQNQVGPYGAGLMVGYPVIPDVTAVAEWQLFQSDVVFFSLIILGSVIAAVGISGGMYIIRNLIWTEGVFVANDFVRGIKRNFFNVMEATLFFSVVLFLTHTMGNLADVYIVSGSNLAGWMIASKVVGYILDVFALLVSLWMISLGVNYKQGPWALFRNAVIMTVGTLPQTIFFAAIGLIPVLLVLFTSMPLSFIFLFIFALIGISFFMLVWMDYSQWAFDKFINPDLGVQVGRGLYSKTQKGEDAATAPKTEEESAAMREYRRMLIARGKSKLISRPIKPIDDGLEVYQLPESFSRDDLRKLKESKEQIEESVKAFEEEHQNDEQYVEYNRLFDERERAIREEEAGQKKKKKKQKHPPKMLNKR